MNIKTEYKTGMLVSTAVCVLKVKIENETETTLLKANSIFIHQEASLCLRQIYVSEKKKLARNDYDSILEIAG